MRPDLMELDELPPLPPVTPVLSPLDIEAALLALTGGSVVDWTALRFTSHDEVNSFLGDPRAECRPGCVNQASHVSLTEPALDQPDL